MACDRQKGAEITKVSSTETSEQADIAKVLTQRRVVTFASAGAPHDASNHEATAGLPR